MIISFALASQIPYYFPCFSFGPPLCAPPDCSLGFPYSIIQRNRSPHVGIGCLSATHAGRKRTLALRGAKGDHRAKRGSSRSRSRAALVEWRKRENPSGMLRGGCKGGRLWGCAPFSAPLASPPKHPSRAFPFPPFHEGCAAFAPGASSLRSVISLRAAQCQSALSR